MIQYHTIIEVDGINVQPLTVDSIQIFAGQRYSFVLNADQSIDNYWIRALPNVDNATFDGGVNSAILRYMHAPHRDPKNTSQTPSLNPLLETNLHPLDDPAAPGVPTPGAADVDLNLAIGFDPTKFQFTINGAQFIPPTVPVLLQILSGAKTAQDLLPSGSIYLLPRNKVVEVSIPGGAPGAPHPFHLHGHTFSVIRSAGNSTYNFANPVRRDVVSTGLESDNVTIRFTTDNPGPWIFHCHIDWHLEGGLAIVFAEDVPDVAQLNPPSSWDALCPAFDDANPDQKSK
ncbi:Acyl-coenzyme A oxidase 2 [Termitomyces sp. T159_Od127]|nr:Acyl-coenzyme A oxidase 2 [Termitomyces sp. T159_Od127]